MATAAAAAPIKHPDRFFIDGTWAAPSSSAKIDVINSSTEKLFTRVAEAKEADVTRAVAAAREALRPGTVAAHEPCRAGEVSAGDSGLFAASDKDHYVKSPTAIQRPQP